MSNDPLAGRRKDAPLPVRWVEPSFAIVGPVAKSVQNWDYYEGALVTVGFTDGKTYNVAGSGVMVAPGLVLTATHVVREHADALEAKSLNLYCHGLRSKGRADLWVYRSLTYAEDESDIAFVGVELNSEIGDDWYVSCLPISTRAPSKGEALSIVGFRFDDPGAVAALPPIDGIPVASRGQLYIAAGKTEDVYYPIHDRVMAPFPTIEVTCGSLGGMSGGAVIDREGAVVGILSNSLNTADGRGPSFAAWIIHALMFEVTLPWPPGLYTPKTPILDLPESQIKIIGRDKVERTGPRQIDYSLWR